VAPLIPFCRISPFAIGRELADVALRKQSNSSGRFESFQFSGSLELHIVVSRATRDPSGLAGEQKLLHWCTSK